MEPRIQYAKTSDGVSIAYAIAGDGPPLLVTANPPQTHVQRAWQFPGNILPPLSQSYRVVWYDSRASGLSQRDAVDFSLDAMTLDAEAVVAQSGLERFMLLASWDGVPIAIRYAASHPERVSHLVLADGWSKFADYLETPSTEAEMALRKKDWILYTETLGRILVGFKDDATGALYAEYLRAAVEPDAYWSAETAMLDWDVTDMLPHISVPTLVLHNNGNRFLPVQSGQRLAAAIPNARFLLIDDFQYSGVRPLLEEFVGHIPVAAPPDRGGFRTILFTDIEGSTALTQRLGDAKARDVLREHERIVREALKSHGGSEVKTMGDGFMASFGSATGALECAIAMQRAFAVHNEPEETPIRVRIGLNAGEPIAEDDPGGRGDLFGTAVIIAASIAAQAQGGEILASNVVRELVAGKGFLFADRGEQVLRGFEDPVRLFEVRWREEA